MSKLRNINGENMRENYVMKTAVLFIAMFWNLENFFDPFDDPATADEMFTPKGEYHWTWKKFAKKRDDIAKVLISTGDEYGVFPSFIGIAEVENRFVLNQLVRETPLSKLGYSVIHRDSPDKRGIDVGLLYRKEDFKPLNVKYYQLKTLSTRLILYAKGICTKLPAFSESEKYGDTLHILVNHWPSKLGAANVTYRNRMIASNTVKHVTDSILKVNSNAKIVLMGDFNDTPDSEPIQNLKKFDNLALRTLKKNRKVGTNKYKESWNLIDQILISPGLTTAQEKNINSRMDIFSKNLLIEDKIYLGNKPNRTFVGPRYQGGISDHLPVIWVIQ